MAKIQDIPGYGTIVRADDGRPLATFEDGVDDATNARNARNYLAGRPVVKYDSRTFTGGGDGDDGVMKPMKPFDKKQYKRKIKQKYKAKYKAKYAVNSDGDVSGGQGSLKNVAQGTATMMKPESALNGPGFPGGGK